MEKQLLKITNKAQFERLVQIMERNPEIARGKPKFGMTKNTCKELWEGFSVELNSLGPPTRTSAEWQRVWIHYKASVKKKIVNNKKNILATGGGPSQEIFLSSLEKCVSRLISLKEQVVPSGQVFGAENIPPANCDAPVPSSGVQTCQPEPIQLDECAHLVVFIHRTAATPNTSRRRENRNCMEKERLELLSNQAQTQTEILKTLKDLEKTIYKNYELNKQILKIKQKKVALYELQVNQATELHNLKVECENLKIEKLKNEIQM